MTLLKVVQDVCEVVGVQAPSSVFSNIASNRTMQEMLTLANEMSQRIAYDTRDWTLFRTSVTYPGAATPVTDFVLPADYKRMLLTTNLWRSGNTGAPLRFLPDTDEWLKRRTANSSGGGPGEWTMYGGVIKVSPGLSATETLNFVYLHKNCIKLASGGNGDVFQSDSDSYALDERVLKLGMIWQWKAQKGSPYAEDVGTYGDALTNLMGHDNPAPIIIGRKAISHAANVAYPWPVPT